MSKHPLLKNFTHFDPTPSSKMLRVFGVTTCANCQAEVTTPNSGLLVSAGKNAPVTKTKAWLLEQGLLEKAMPSNAGYHHDETPSNECCDTCLPHCQSRP